MNCARLEEGPGGFGQCGGASLMQLQVRAGQGLQAWQGL